MNGNGSKEAEAKVKKCPFLNEWCIEGACALFTGIRQANPLGGIQMGGICAFGALVMMISELNAKTQPPVQKIELPKLFRG